MVALEIDREQVQEDLQIVKEIGAILLFVSSGVLAAVENVLWDVAPPWLETIILYALGIGTILVWAMVLYERYTVEENAGGSGTEDSV